MCGRFTGDQSLRQWARVLGTAVDAATAEQLHLQPGRVFTMETPDDPIQWVYDGPSIAHRVAPALPFPFNVLATTTLGAADATGAGQFGPNPAANPHFTHLSTGAATVPDGHGDADEPPRSWPP